MAKPTYYVDRSMLGDDLDRLGRGVSADAIDLDVLCAALAERCPDVTIVPIQEYGEGARRNGYMSDRDELVPDDAWRAALDEVCQTAENARVHG